MEAEDVRRGLLLYACRGRVEGRAFAALSAVLNGEDLAGGTQAPTAGPGPGPGEILQEAVWTAEAWFNLVQPLVQHQLANLSMTDIDTNQQLTITERFGKVQLLTGIVLISLT